MPKPSQAKPEGGHSASGSAVTALFAGSFDPLTLGHLDLIRRASGLFTTVIVALGEAQGKQPLFTTAERRELIKASCQGLGNVQVEVFRGLAVSCAERLGAAVFVRGLRSLGDFDYEMQMAQMNLALNPAIETVFLPTSPALRHISSSMAKDIARHGGDVSLLVPPPVAAAFRQKQAEAAAMASP